jgi:hypothetical protein
MQMDPIRTWTLPGETPLTIRVYAPVTTIAYGDTPEVPFSPKQVTNLAERLGEIEDYYQDADPDML